MGAGSAKPKKDKPKLSDKDLAAMVFALEVKSMAGEILTTIADARGTWLLADVVGKLPEVVAGHQYELLSGQAKLAASTPIGRWAEPMGGSATVTAVVVQKPDGKLELDLALIQAAGSLEVEAVSRFLSVGADAAFVHDPEGVWGSQDRKSALHAAIEAPKKATEEEGNLQRAVQKEVMELLLQAGADVNAVRSKSDWRGCGYSSTAFDMVLPLAFKDTDILVRFLAAGADPNAKFTSRTHSMRTDGSTTRCPLHNAVEYGSLAAARVLLDAGADVNALLVSKYDNERGFNQDSEETALHMAAGMGQLSMVALLLERGADVNAVRRNLEQHEVEAPEPPVTDEPRDSRFVPTVRCVPVRETALHVAIGRGHKAVVALLVQAGADADIPRITGREQQRTATVLCCGSDAEMLQALTADAAYLRALAGDDEWPAVEAALAVRARHPT